MSPQRVEPLALLLLFPPRAYARMPYAAPYLLKGYVEETSEHRVDVLDLNIRYHVAVWTATMPLASSDLPCETKARLEVVREIGPRALALMRDASSYTNENRRLLRLANEILLGAERLEHDITTLSGWANQSLPEAHGTWPTLLDDLERTPMGRFLRAALAEHDLREYDVVGVSCAYIEQIAPALLIARQLRAQDFVGRVIIGGSGFTHVLRDALLDGSLWEDIDYGVPYEGEVTLREVLDGLASDDYSFEGRNVVFWRDGRGVFADRIHERPAVHPVANFSTIEHLFPTPSPVYPLLTSKGCYWGKCAFCTHHEGYGQGFSMAPNDAIEQSVAHVAHLGGQHFYFVDEALPATKVRYLAELFDRLRREGRIEAPAWMAECRVERYSTDPAFLDTLAASGCKLIISGMETGSQEVMTRMRKGVELKQAREFARLCRKIGIQTAWMFFIGFPGETLNQMDETFSLIEECRDDLDYATVGTFGLERDSPVWNTPERFGVREILGVNDPYRLVFDYIEDTGSIRRRADLRDALRVFMEYYSQHMELFLRIIERSCAVFFCGGHGGEPPRSPPPDRERM